MDGYKRKSSWKLILAITGALIVLITVFYSSYLAKQLAQKEEEEAQRYAKTVKVVFKNSEVNQSFGIEAEILENVSFPVIIEDEFGTFMGKNFGAKRDTNQVFLQRKVKQLLNNGFKPIVGEGYAKNIYYTRSTLYKLITFFPIIQILLVASFIFFGYTGFQRSRKLEQNLVWAGLAKETAHQLGTPISALMAWIENLKLSIHDNPEQQEIVDELVHDVDRLELIADRFSKIGSVPELETKNIIQTLNEAKHYMMRRSPRRVEFDFPTAEDNEPIMVDINEHLFHWVIENIIRNSLDAMDGFGKISADVYQDGGYVFVDISDTGKGIEGKNFNAVFDPGFSTKKRGWGLGLSLAKRIIKNYHKGKIFIKKSVVGVGTTITIQLPKK